MGGALGVVNSDIAAEVVVWEVDREIAERFEQ